MDGTAVLLLRDAASLAGTKAISFSSAAVLPRRFRGWGLNHLRRKQEAKQPSRAHRVASIRPYVRLPGRLAQSVGAVLGGTGHLYMYPSGYGRCRCQTKHSSADIPNRLISIPAGKRREWRCIMHGRLLQPALPTRLGKNWSSGETSCART